ncbi:hypothetical protein TIFTF001_002317 [Ficus carica]|uniref:Homeobox domain-containing protein n=1 Tax=Ficus carica TaxID=3494 RepID=A0AA87Z5C6_FICCA|nr:hypothetical protein TIFTF001_002317 [Ficus carica]
MEPQQQQQENQVGANNDQQDMSNGSGGGGGGNNKGGGTTFLCRQSSTRWTPTSDQIRILKDLYYNNGVRSPSAEQIQRISARLRQYGKIEGKNVFYWFQNHKALVSSGSPSSASMLGVNGQMGHYGYGPVAMEKAFRDLMMINGYGNMIKPPGFPDPAPIGGGGSGYYPAGHVSSRTSLELTLNSYRPSPDSL